ncbi:bifunctional UDP-N-acetylglucosamine diphosphorylase/glucosamine-1-phosphate N-acetyltransferase GlmU [Primorskyibacter sp. S187A]|uniref:bifunctional UDP-N-acetylglucosamine diphosphorylase/glucosamine-1-phosphate N-acetyltransferase GlmU n=1 Tax=Primorskyibacter sp. S187A TaxID=3415130 RepID=UPI003C7D5D56
MGLHLVILAAGKGTRMRSDLPKVLHQVAHAPLLIHAMKAGEALDPLSTIIVAGHGAEAVETAAKAHTPDVQVVLQNEQLGTAHAVDQARAQLKDAEGDVVVLYGDTPFIQPETIARMQEARARHDIVVLGFDAADPGKYGRLVMQGERLERIVEFKDANESERAISFCNSGVILAPAKVMFELIAEVGNDNASGEYYLTDLPALAQARGLSATAVACDESETLGVNSRADLAAAEEAFQTRQRATLLEIGVTLSAPQTVHLAHDTLIGPDTIIEQHVVFGPGVTVENGAHIRAFSHLEGCHVSRGAIVGPYARLRPGAEIAEHARIGNFVEIKNAEIAEAAKVNHLTYIGDARVGTRSNIGAGTVTCNYDGVMKHHTEIGADTFIGSNTMLVAPVRVGDRAMTATSSTITTDVPDEALAIGRAKQTNKAGLAVKLFEMLRAKKAGQVKGE